MLLTGVFVLKSKLLPKLSTKITRFGSKPAETKLIISKDINIIMIFIFFFL